MVSLVVFGLDQATKWLIVTKIYPGGSIEVIPNFFNLVHVNNFGVAFGVLAAGHPFKLVAVASLALIPLVYLVVKADPRQLGFITGVGLMVGGALGNILDRLRVGSVIDFIDLHLSGYHWPAFNLADIAICLGCVFILIYLIKSDSGEPKKDKA